MNALFQGSGEHDHEHRDHDHRGNDHGHSQDEHHNGPTAPTRTVLIEQDVLAKNDRLAERNRAWLAARGVAVNKRGHAAAWAGRPGGRAPAFSAAASQISTAAVAAIVAVAAVVGVRSTRTSALPEDAADVGQWTQRHRARQERSGDDARTKRAPR